MAAWSGGLGAKKRYEMELEQHVLKVAARGEYVTFLLMLPSTRSALVPSGTLWLILSTTLSVPSS